MPMISVGSLARLANLSMSMLEVHEASDVFRLLLVKEFGNVWNLVDQFFTHVSAIKASVKNSVCLGPGIVHSTVTGLCDVSKMKM